MTRNKLIFFIFIFLVFGQYCDGQTIKKDSLLKELRMADRVESKEIGFERKTSTIFKTAQLLIDICPIDTLVKLTSDSSSVVCCYALSGLIQKKADKEIVKDIADKNKNNTTKITTMYGDRGMQTTVGQYMEMESNVYCTFYNQQQLDSINVIKK
jgi:hypothetical protein